MSKEAALDKFSGPVPVLDHGFVELIDLMGDDVAITSAARVSYKGAKSTSDDRSLIRYLMHHQHTSPIEMCEIKLHCKMPIFVARQWIRHRTASVNEVSGRYSILPDEMYVPDRSAIAFQSESNKQGRADLLADEVTANEFLRLLSQSQDTARDSYEASLKHGIAKELARINLPVSQYTEWFWKIDLKNLLHFLNLRMDSHAQYEIRVYANAIAEILKAWVPLTWEAFEDYVLGAVTFSKPEMELIKKLADSDRGHYSDFNHRLSAREFQEFCAKLPLIGYDPAEYFPATPDHDVPG
jgi:thymidylate synthase (FAD)